MNTLQDHLVYLLEEGGAHATFESTVEDFPVDLRGVRPEGMPHSGWELLDHMRIAQWDILEFSRDPKHVSPDFPKGYWPQTPAPAHKGDWDQAVKSFLRDRKGLVELARSTPDLLAPIPHGDGQTVLREILLAADHNAYHLGQLLLVRRLLGAWGK
ncbi:MAG: DinB family protein [Bryobacteraceae bacterium]